MGTQLQLDQMSGEVSIHMNNIPTTIHTGRRRNNLLLRAVKIDIKSLHSPAVDNYLTRHTRVHVTKVNSLRFVCREGLPVAGPTGIITGGGAP